MVWALADVFKWRLIIRFFLKLMFKGFSMMSPFLIFNFTEFVEKDEEKLEQSDYSNAMLLAFGIVIFELIEYSSHEVFDFHIRQARIVAAKTIKVLLFDKFFRLSSSGKRSYTFAQVLSLINQEAGRVYDCIQMVTDMIMEPFELLYCAFFIYYYLGWSVLSGLALWLLRFGFLKLFKDEKLEYHMKMQELSD